MVARAPSRILSARAITASARRSSIITTALSPRSSAAESASPSAAGMPTPSSSAHSGRPTRSKRPSALPSSPCPGTALTSMLFATRRSCCCAASTMAAARGCSEARSRLAASESAALASSPSTETLDTTNRPSVRVPVLSNATYRMLRPRSNASRLRTRMPFLAEMAVAFMVTRGMARPKAWGQAITSTVTARATANVAPLVPSISHTTSVGSETPTATTVSQKAARSAST